MPKHPVSMLDVYVPCKERIAARDGDLSSIVAYNESEHQVTVSVSYSSSPQGVGMYKQVLFETLLPKEGKVVILPRTAYYKRVKVKASIDGAARVQLYSSGGIAHVRDME